MLILRMILASSEPSVNFFSLWEVQEIGAGTARPRRFPTGTVLTGTGPSPLLFACRLNRPGRKKAAFQHEKKKPGFQTRSFPHILQRELDFFSSPAKDHRQHATIIPPSPFSASHQYWGQVSPGLYM